MTKYYLIDTWNGSGYSESGIIDTAESIEEANRKALKQYQDRYLSMVLIGGDYEIDVKDESTLYFRHYEDWGAIHVVEGDDIAGLIIMPDTNDVAILQTKADVDSAIDIAYGTAMNEEEAKDFMNEIEDTGNGGVHTDLGYEIIYDLK